MNAMIPIANTDELKKVGEILARSAMFGCKTVEQGCVLALTCQAEGMSPLQFRRTFHIIEGDVTMRADAMLAEFSAQGGRYAVIERTPTAARLLAWTVDPDDGHPSSKEDAYEWAFTWEDAVAAELPFKKVKGQPTDELKHNWRTVPKNMLWARCVSDMVRTIKPSVVCGVYTPEETSDFGSREIVLESTSTPATAATAATANHAKDEDEDVIDVEAKPAAATAPADVDSSAPAPAADGLAFPVIEGRMKGMSGLLVAALNQKQVDFLWQRGRELEWWNDAYQAALEARAKELAAQ